MIEDFSYGTPRPGALPHGSQDWPGLLVLTDDEATYELETAAEAAGLQWLGATPLAQASARLDSQAPCEAILLFCPTLTPGLEALLATLRRVVAERALSAILVAGVETLDLAYAGVGEGPAQLLCQPERADLVAALLTAAEGARIRRILHDRGKDDDSARLQQLSEEVGRLARTIEALTRRSPPAAPSFDLGPRISDSPSDYIGMPPLPPLGAGSPGSEPAPVTAAQVRDLLRARRMRADFLPGDLFADPAWDMMLDLLAARLEHERVSVSSLCIASAVPPTTALRWIRTLSEKGLIERQNDPHDGRRIFIALTEQAVQGLVRWFAASRRYRGS